MNRVELFCAYVAADIARAVGEDSEMVDDGYIAELSPPQLEFLEAYGLPTGVPVSP